MTTEEAEEVFGMIATIYDLHPERRGDQATVWIPMLESHDVHEAMKVVLKWSSGEAPERFPTAPEFARFLIALRPRRWGGVECSLCEDTGQVVVERSEMEEAMGPCPSCERGKALEFPLEGVGPWGVDGYWRGRTYKAGEGPLEVEVLG